MHTPTAAYPFARPPTFLTITRLINPPTLYGIQEKQIMTIPNSLSQTCVTKKIA